MTAFGTVLSYSFGGGQDLGCLDNASLPTVPEPPAVAALPALALPFIIRAAVAEGVATATEVSTLGIVSAALAGLLIYRQFDWHRLGPMLVGTAALSGAILLIIGTATAMAWGLTHSGFSRWLAAEMAAVPWLSTGFL